MPVRYNWAAEYRGPAAVVYGHTPVPEPEWLNRTINIDGGCVFGGKLTALRYPEKELVSVKARAVYCTPVRPLEPAADTGSGLTVQQRYDDMLDAEDVLGKRYITTGLHSRVTIRENQATAALELISRFAVNPKWLIYLPPTMAPTETSKRDGFLERPEEGFAYFRTRGIPSVVCQEKHMRSRAVVVVCWDEGAAAKHFGVLDEGIGVVYTRTGWRFFDDLELEKNLLDRVASALSATGFWESLATDWVCLDCELIPWSEKAQGLLGSQYAAVGAAAGVSLDSAIQAVMKTAERSHLETNFELPASSTTCELDLPGLLGKIVRRKNDVEDYIKAYRRYCWPVHSLNDLKLAPFHVLATEGKMHTDKNHEWHMQRIAEICSRDQQLLLATAFYTIEVTADSSLKAGSNWWEAPTSESGEGMVIKPFDFVARGNKGLVQPAVKCRGRKYLRIIYGPEYTAEGNLERLRSRALGTKRSLALRGFALGIEGLERFVRREPLRRIHECIFGVLAVESEPVDPRL